MINLKKGKIAAYIKEIIISVILLYILWIIIKSLFLGN